jgi:antitoxin component YwqK of YwqJK toxin-antitoxin module
MNKLLLTILIFFYLSHSYCQDKIASTEYQGKSYFIYPESHDEKYMNINTLTWKDNIIREKYRLNKEQTTDGKWIQFYKNHDSIPAKIFELKNGKLNGKYSQYYENGQIELIENYLDENITDLGVHYFENGKIRDSVKYKLDTARNGYVFSNKIYMKSFYENGNLRKIETYDSTGVKNGKWTEYYENGQIKIEEYFTNTNINLDNSANKNSYGKRTKTLSYYYPNGQLRFALNYSNDKIEDGLFIEYYPSGNKKINGNLNNELRSDSWTEFYESGKTKASGDFSSGNYTICGAVPFTAYYEYKIGEWNYYYPNGEIKANGIYEYGLKNIETNCEGGANINCGELTNEWSFYDNDGIGIPLVNALEKGIVADKEVYRKRIYLIE